MLIRFTIQKLIQLKFYQNTFIIYENGRLTKLDTGSGRPSLTQAILNEIPIFVPSIEEQHRIVSILDKFETLTNSITEGFAFSD